MIDYRVLLRLHSRNQRRIEANVHSSHQTVKAVLENAAKYGISWPLDDEMTHEKLNEILSISAKEHEVITYAEPDYAYIHRELSKKGVTLTLLWSEYCERCYQYTVRRLTKFAINNKKADDRKRVCRRTAHCTADGIYKDKQKCG